MRRWARRGLLAAGVAMGLVQAAAGQAAAQTGPGPVATDRFVVLDTAGAWRMHHTLKMPVIAFDDGLKAVPPAGADAAQWTAVLSDPTPAPPADWTQADFDDGGWVRGAAIRACQTPYLERLCLRGKFAVDDPAAVKGLVLSADFHGGVIVYLNGRELARGHLAPGAKAPDGLAEPYGPEAFVSADNKLLNLRGWDPKRAQADEGTLRRMALRGRTISVPLPSGHLRRGLNAVALEIVRAPYHKVVDNFKAVQGYKTTEKTHDLSWNTCQIARVSLTADAGAGPAAGAARPQGVQVWNSDPMATDFDLDVGNPAEALRPIRLVGARNGAVSGKVVVGSRQALVGLRAKAGELKSDGGGVIPASAVRIRYAVPWGNVPLTTEDNFETVPYPGPARPLLAILEVPLPEFPVSGQASPPDAPPASSRSAGPAYLPVPGGSASFAGAVVPVWVTVNVPADAKPGRYSGTVAIELQGKALAEADLELTVLDFLLPDPKDVRTWVEAVQSPDTLAVHYGLELWSDRHFEMIARSMTYLRDLGSRVVYVPLVARTNLGNAETMVRWVSKGDGDYEHDFAAMDRYLDLVQKHMDPPRFVVFNVWDLHLAAEGGGPRSAYSSRAVGTAPMVTLRDPASAKTENIHLLPYEDPNAQAVWGKLFDQLRRRMRQRGLEQAMVLGMASDIWPSKQQTLALQRISGDLPWSITSHGSYWQKTKPLYEIAEIGYHVHAFGTQFGFGRSLMGWNQPVLHAGFERWGNIPHTPLVRWRSFQEIGITGSVRGMARLGGDFWPVEFPARGGRVTHAQVWARFPEADLKQLSLKTTLLAPGPDGPVASARYEAFREGLQECEARIVLEEALSDPQRRKQLDDNLVQRAEAALAERQKCMWRSLSAMQVGPAATHSFAGWRAMATGVTGYTWYLGSGWQERTETLYAVAAAVRARLAAP